MTKRGPKPCTVCTSEHRHQIEIGLVHGISTRALSDRFKLSRDSIYRHARNHLTPQMRAALLTASGPAKAVDLEELKKTEGEGILSQIIAQRARLQHMVDFALEHHDIRGAVAAEAQIGSNIALAAKLLGQLVNVHDVRRASILVSPDYLKFREVLFKALQPFPDAARAVGSALHRLESDAAHDITQAAKEAPKPLPPLIEHVPG